MGDGLHYLPITATFFYFLIGILLGLAVLLGIGVLRYTYESIGISHRYILFLLLLSLLGSFINIPIARLPHREVVAHSVVDLWGVQYLAPTVVDWPGTIIAVNLGGAVIPLVLSLYLIWKNRFWGQALLGVSIVAIATNQLSQPVYGVGIAVPFFLPPLIASTSAFLLTRRRAAALAFVSGSLGTLIGADLFNLDEIASLGTPLASIGGSGTFDGIFLTGVFAVLLAGLFGRFSHEE